ncbi:MAG: 3-isopropylmalate dehydratase small subunit [Lysobacterales bacterium]
MKALRSIRSKALALPRSNIDTDQIIPARFLSTTERGGLGRHAFNDWRYRKDGSPDPAFVLNRAESAGRSILVTGANFGCGSSREHAPWALIDAGINAVVASEIADIFRGNALKNGLLPVVLPEAVVAELLANPDWELHIDVALCTLTVPDGRRFTFPLDAFQQTCLLDGSDELGYLLARSAAIATFEENRHAR